MNTFPVLEAYAKAISRALVLGSLLLVFCHSAKGLDTIGSIHGTHPKSSPKAAPRIHHVSHATVPRKMVVVRHPVRPLSPHRVIAHSTTPAKAVLHADVAYISTPASASVDVGKTVTLAATAYDITGAVVQVTPATFKWSSSDSTLATIDANSGTVTGIAPGSVTVNVTNIESGKTRTTVVTIVASLASTWFGISRDSVGGTYKSRFIIQPNGSAKGMLDTHSGTYNFAANGTYSGSGDDGKNVSVGTWSLTVNTLTINAINTDNGMSYTVTLIRQ